MDKEKLEFKENKMNVPKHCKFTKRFYLIISESLSK